MPTQEEGIVNLDVKKEWKHEALHFTPWLAKNLDAQSNWSGAGV